MATTEHLSFQKDYLAEQIRTRYAMFDREKDGKSNLVIDSIAPKWIFNKLKGNNKDKYGNTTIGDEKPKSSYAISEYFAEIFRCQKIPFNDLIGIIGYTPKQINSLLHKVSKKKLSIVFVGYGGTGVNTLYWLREMAVMCHKVNIFESIAIYENEKAEYSNILRFPKNVMNTKNGSTHKLHILTNEKILARNFVLSPNLIDADTITKITTENADIIFYGAPSIETRELLQPYNFISATHGDDDCSILIKPTQDSRIQHESYGVIRLSSFFMNQLRMAIGLLEFLSQDEISWEQQTFLDYNFVTAETNIDKYKYNFQLQHSGILSDGNNTVDTEPAAVGDENETEESTVQ